MVSGQGLSQVLDQLTARYRRAVVLKAALLAVLGVGVLGILCWRLRLLRLDPMWSLGAPGVLGGAGTIGLVWWLRRRWISRQGATASLDQALDLQQRLITAEEFASANPPPVLYPLLVKDASSRVGSERLRLPRLVDRTTAALACLLLLLLFWPLGGRAPFQQLAQLPQLKMPARSPGPPTSPPPQQAEQHQQAQLQQGSSSSQPSAQQGSGGGADQPRASDAGRLPPSSPQSGGEGQSANQSSLEEADARSPRDAGLQQSGQGRQQQQTESERAQGAARDGEGRAGAGSQQRATPHRDSGQASDAQQGAGGQPASPPSSGGPRKPEEQRQANGGGENRSRQSASAGQRAEQNRQQGERGSGQAAQGGASSSSASNPPDGRGPSQGSPAGQQVGVGQSSSGQEAMKAEIQALLKEVSGELKQLQSQLAAAKAGAAASPGAATDPELYGASAPLESPDDGEALPIQLQTDTAQTQTKRPNSGVGRPAGEILPDAPQAQAEDAQLSEAPREEKAAERHVVPPEYRTVFDRLNRTEPK